MEKIGLIAGRGKFPILFAVQAAKKGFDIFAICVKRNTSRVLIKNVSGFCWLDIREFKRIPEIFKARGIKQAAMAGQINPYLLFNKKVMAYPEVKEFFGIVQDKRADTVFKIFADRLNKEGLKLLDSTFALAEFMPGESVLTARNPSPQEYEDINLGFKAAKHLGAMDIGQSVCVKEGIVLAVESIEGTDNTIRRAKRLIRVKASLLHWRTDPVVLVKTSKPAQDMRFDVPVVGLNTIKNLPQGSCLAIEAKKTLFIDLEKAVKLADEKNIAVVSIKSC